MTGANEKKLEWLPADLAPGDAKSAGLDLSGFQLVRIHSATHPLFEEAYQKLWAEFGARNELEQRAVLMRRFQWAPARPVSGCALRYEMILLRSGEKFAGVRDHTAIVPRARAGAVVHLSHVLVDPVWRRSGLAGWLRALPIQTARECLLAAGVSPTAPITLVAEMEHPAPEHPERLLRLLAYEKAGFKKLDPRAVPYLQPDFRSTVAIDASGGPRPLPFGLIVRRVNREQEQTITGAEARGMVETFYQMYGAGFRAQDMALVWKNLDNFPVPNATVRLLPPTTLSE